MMRAIFDQPVRLPQGVCGRGCAFKRTLAFGSRRDKTESY
jgi:hypothetical protein